MMLACIGPAAFPSHRSVATATRSINKQQAASTCNQHPQTTTAKATAAYGSTPGGEERMEGLRDGIERIIGDLPWLRTLLLAGSIRETLVWYVQYVRTAL